MAKFDGIKKIGITALLVSGFVVYLLGSQNQDVSVPLEGEGAVAPVLVELFTSEGCSSCPPAEELMNEFWRQGTVLGAEVITLQYHVDYWDRLGWKDVFASKDYTNRQYQYQSAFGLSTVYTPQMIVDGSDEFVGSSKGKALAAIDNAKRIQKVELESKWEVRQDGTMALHVSSETLVPAGSDLNLNIIISEDQLTRTIESGENRGKTLQHNSVVRSFRQIDTVPAGQTVDSIIGMSFPKEWNKQNLRVVVLIQDPKTMKIMGVSTKSLKEISS